MWRGTCPSLNTQGKSVRFKLCTQLTPQLRISLLTFWVEKWGLGPLKPPFQGLPGQRVAQEGVHPSLPLLPSTLPGKPSDPRPRLREQKTYA